jgi:hypothetical protein
LHLRTEVLDRRAGAILVLTGDGNLLRLHQLQPDEYQRRNNCDMPDDFGEVARTKALHTSSSYRRPPCLRETLAFASI